MRVCVFVNFYYVLLRRTKYSQWIIFCCSVIHFFFLLLTALTIYLSSVANKQKYSVAFITFTHTILLSAKFPVSNLLIFFFFWLNIVREMKFSKRNFRETSTGAKLFLFYFIYFRNSFFVDYFVGNCVYRFIEHTYQHVITNSVSIDNHIYCH